LLSSYNTAVGKYIIITIYSSNDHNHDENDLDSEAFDDYNNDDDHNDIISYTNLSILLSL